MRWSGAQRSSTIPFTPSPSTPAAARPPLRTGSPQRSRRANAARFSVLLALAAACAAGKPAADKAPAAAVPDSALGLSKTSVFDVPAPPAVKTNDAAPGELAPPPRPYALAPPRVPHGIGDFLPITAKANACVDCHAVAEKEKGQPTPLPASHYTDYRNAPGKRGDKVAGARWVCTACHVPLTDAKPLVVNGFTP